MRESADLVCQFASRGCSDEVEVSVTHRVARDARRSAIVCSHYPGGDCSAAHSSDRPAVSIHACRDHAEERTAGRACPKQFRYDSRAPGQGTESRDQNPQGPTYRAGLHP